MDPQTTTPSLTSPECVLALSVWGAPAFVAILAWGGLLPLDLAGPAAGASIVLVGIGSAWCASRP